MGQALMLAAGVGTLCGATRPMDFCLQLTEGKMMERRKKIALELSELVVYCRPVPFDEESKLVTWVCAKETMW